MIFDVKVVVLKNLLSSYSSFFIYEKHIKVGQEARSLLPQYGILLQRKDERLAGEKKKKIINRHRFYFFVRKLRRKKKVLTGIQPFSNPSSDVFI